MCWAGWQIPDWAEANIMIGRKGKALNTYHTQHTEYFFPLPQWSSKKIFITISALRFPLHDKVTEDKQQSAFQKSVPFHLIKKLLWHFWWIIMITFNAYMVQSTGEFHFTLMRVTDVLIFPKENCCALCISWLTLVMDSWWYSSTFRNKRKPGYSKVDMGHMCIASKQCTCTTLGFWHLIIH